MFSFLRKSKEPEFPDYFPIHTDIHSHILPGIDDGAVNVETSIFLVKGLMNLGVTKSIATPHIIGDLYKNDASTIQQSLSKLKSELAIQQIDFEVSAAAEYMLDSYFLELLQRKEKLLTIKDNYILTEFSYAFAPTNLNELSFEIQMSGYKPILAHPERYGYFQHNLKTYNRLVDLGFMLQINLLSLAGFYGKGAANAAVYIIENGLASYLGTDLHHDKHLLMLSDPKTRNILHKHLSERHWNDL